MHLLIICWYITVFITYKSMQNVLPLMHEITLIRWVETFINDYERASNYFCFAFCVLNHTILQNLNIMLVNHTFCRYNNIVFVMTNLIWHDLIRWLNNWECLINSNERAERACKIITILRLKYAIVWDINILLVNRILIFVGTIYCTSIYNTYDGS